MSFAVDSTGIHVFALTLYWYGIVVVVAAWIAVEVATWLAAHQGFDPGHVWHGLIPVILLGLAGARLWFVLFPPESVVANGLTAGWLLSHFFDLNQGAIAAWTGGLGMIGGMVGGTLGLFYYTRRHKLPSLPWLDIAAIALSLAQALGWWSSAFNGQGYGPVTTLPWGILITNPDQRVGPYTDLTRYPLASTYFQPVFAYESLWILLVFVALVVIYLRYRNRIRAGDLALSYLALYGIGRALLEFLRVNVSRLGGVNISQVVVAGAALVAILSLWRRTNVLPPSHEFHGNLDGTRLQ